LPVQRRGIGSGNESAGDRPDWPRRRPRPNGISPYQNQGRIQSEL